MLVHLKNITDNFNNIKDPDDIIGIYSCDIVFLDSLNENIEKQIARDGIEIYSINNYKMKIHKAKN